MGTFKVTFLILIKMEELNGVTIYWLISLGLFIGFIIDILMIKQGIGMIGNLIWGAIGAIIFGVTAIQLNLFGPLIFASLGAVSFLFLINVFSFFASDQVDAKAI